MPYDVEDRLTQTPKPLFTQTPPPKAQMAPRELQSSGDIHILVLDDDPHTCAVIQAALSNRDFVIDVVSDPMMVESAMNVMVPVGVPPFRRPAAMVVVNVTDCPKSDGFMELLVVIRVPPVFSRVVTVLLPLLATLRSSAPSAFTSAIAMLIGLVPD